MHHMMVHISSGQVNPQGDAGDCEDLIIVKPIDQPFKFGCSYHALMTTRARARHRFIDQTTLVDGRLRKESNWIWDSTSTRDQAAGCRGV